MNFESIGIRADGLRRNFSYATVEIAGLALGFVAAILIGLFVSYERGHDRGLDPKDEIVRISAYFKRADAALDTSQKQLAAILPSQVPGVLAATRLLPETHSVRAQAVEFNETVYWADPNLFAVLPLALKATDGSKVLSRPNTAVISEAMARKYFGAADAVGGTLQLDRGANFQVVGIIKDLPANSHLGSEILLSGETADAGMKALDADDPDFIGAPVYTYFKKAPGTDLAALQARMTALIDRNWTQSSGEKMSETLDLKLTYVRDIHLHGTGEFAMRPGGDATTINALALVAFLIVLAASLNFVNLMTARASRRMIEVGVRKCFGASRRDLIAQFVGEASAFVIVAFLLAVVAAHVLLPVLNAQLGTNIRFDWWNNPLIVLAALGGVLLVAISSSLYPALFLSGFRPADVLRSGRAANTGSNLLRSTLIVVQFAVFIALLISVITIRAQVQYAMSRTTSAPDAAVVLVETDCSGGFPEAVRQIQGVRGVACAQSAPTNKEKIGTSAVMPNGQSIQIDTSPVDFGFFELYAMRPLAGRFFSRDRESDAVIPDLDFQAPLVLNETAVRKLGFASPEVAIGQRITLRKGENPQPSQIIGVVPDFVVNSLREPVAATAYFVDPRKFQWMSVSMDPALQETVLAALDEQWAKLPTSQGPINRFYLDGYFSELYDGTRAQVALFSALAIVASIIALIGLIGLAAFTTSRRVKEIGIRKALGARTRDIVQLLIWQFAKPILWANVIAWPLAALALTNWLNGFAYHISLPIPMFVLCGLATLAIALLFVSIQTWRAARARPALALQYE